MTVLVECVIKERERSVLDGRTKLLVIFHLCMTVLVESLIKERERSVLDGRTKLLVIFLLCMTVLVESLIKERVKYTRWKDKIIGYISLVYDCIGAKCHQRESEVY